MSPDAKDTEQVLTHLDAEGRAKMVDVGQKKESARTAIAKCVVRLSPKTMGLLQEKALPKGDALNTARIAGIQAAKKTSALIPLCHPIFLNYVDLEFKVDPENNLVEVAAEARTTSKTGVEMEAMVAAHVGALTIYDMVKAVQKDVVISDLRLVYKCGGKSGVFRAE